MHHESKKADFIVLRSQNCSLKRIAKELNVCLRTLVDWNREFDDAIHLTRHLNADNHFHDLVEARQKDLQQVTLRQDAIDQEIARRDLGDVSTDKLIRLAILSRQEVLQTRSDVESLAESRHFIPDLLLDRARSKAELSSETENAPAPNPTSAHPVSTSAAPIPTDNPPLPVPEQPATPEQSADAESAHERRMNDADAAH